MARVWKSVGIVRSTGAVLLMSVACAASVGGSKTPPPVNAGTDSGQVLLAPSEEDEFSFVIFGDRTGGKPDGLKVLAEAVRMSNWLDPAFVMTVGDLIQGYCEEPEWLRQMREFKSYTDRLNMPWYPVAGNHDVYAQPAKDDGHIDLYKEHFGPLYYSFDYKWAHFICLFSDEALSFSNPAVDQNMGVAQMRWLAADLAGTDASHIFVFLHHPRWRYQGCNWSDVHQMLVDDGRVEAVIAGHIHQYRDDGLRDGIHYYTLAVTGGAKGRFEATSFDHINLVRVRHDGFAMAVLPVGSIHGGDAVLGSEVDELHRLARGEWASVEGTLEAAIDDSRQSSVKLAMFNDARQPLDVTVRESVSKDGRVLWEGVLKPGTTVATVANVSALPIEERAVPRDHLVITATYATQSGRRQKIRLAKRLPLTIDVPDELTAAKPEANGVLSLNGRGTVRVELGETLSDAEAWTIECWVRGHAPRGRMALLNKTENSSFGIFWSQSGSEIPAGMAHVAGAGYVTVRAGERWAFDTWTHLALTHDGGELRLYRDGILQGRAPSGAITSNKLPLFIGADPNGSGEPTSYFTGEIDEVRLSKVARYHGNAFVPQRFFGRDGETLLLLHFDTEVNGIHPDDSGHHRHGAAVGETEIRTGRLSD